MADEPVAEDPVIEHFVELRKYIDHSHEGLSKRLEGVEGRLGSVEAGQQQLDGRLEKVEGGLQQLDRKIDAGFDRLDRKMDAGFEQVTRKIDALARPRRTAPRRGGGSPDMTL